MGDWRFLLACAAAILYPEDLFWGEHMHYLPFSFLYGLRQFIPLSGLLFSAGLLIGLYAPAMAVWGGWLTDIVLLAFAFIGRGIALRTAA